MRKLNIGIIDIVSKGPTRALYARVMNANLASIMPQVIGVWCRQQGHDVTSSVTPVLKICWRSCRITLDLLFIGAFTEAAHTAYALSKFSAPGGRLRFSAGRMPDATPKSRDSYFDYVLGFTDRETLLDVLQDCSQHRPVGVQISAQRQPLALPGVRERWRVHRTDPREDPASSKWFR